MSKWTAAIWALPLLCLLYAAPYREARESELTALTVVGAQVCVTGRTKGHRGGEPVQGCWKLLDGTVLETCRPGFSATCFTPQPEDLKAMLRGEPWSVRAISQGPGTRRVYDIRASDGRVLRTYAEGAAAWRE